MFARYAAASAPPSKPAEAHVANSGAHLELATNALGPEARIRANEHTLMKELIGERRRRVTRAERCRDEPVTARGGQHAARRHDGAVDERIPIGPDAQISREIDITRRRARDMCGRPQA